MSSDSQPSPFDLNAQLARGALTRRDLLRRAGMAGGTLSAASLLAACGGGSVGGASTHNPASSVGNVSYPHTVAPSFS